MSPIHEFLRNEDIGNGWVVKAPFTTNSHGVRFCSASSGDAVWRTIQALSTLMGSIVPYVILQPRLRNKKEYRFLCLDGKVVYKVLKNADSSKGTSFAGAHDFAQSALLTLSERVPSCMSRFMVRVDVMELDGKLVVNEFESFEALFTGKGEHATVMFLSEFWALAIIRNAVEYKSC